MSTHSNPGRPYRRPKSKVRVKRTKRRIGRRIGTMPSDSKSSLDNLEATQPIIQLDSNPADLIHDPVLKKRSLSEERPPTRIKVAGQRSASLQLDTAQTLKSSLSASLNPVTLQKQPPAVPQRKSWFFAWPIRGLVVPNRVANEDEGFDR